MQNRTPQLWIVRKKPVNIIRKWHIGDVTVFNIKEDSTEKIIGQIQSQLRITE